MDSSLSDYTNGYTTINNNNNFDFSLDIDALLSSQSPATLSPDDVEFSETAKYITQILMEETTDDLNPSVFFDPLGLQVTEKSFYDALGEAYPYSHSDSPSSSLDSVESRSFGFNLPTVDELLAQNIFGDSDSVSQFRRGAEEASKFLPKTVQLSVGVGRKNHRERDENDGESSEEEFRSSKHSAVYSGEEEEISELFDKVLLNTDHSCCKDPPENSQNQNHKNKKKETVDLRTLLMLCAQAVSASDSRTATELLKQIRQNSSSIGDSSQRLSHYFADALEARLAGTGAKTKLYYTTLLSKSRAADILKAYQLSLSSTPYKKMSMFFANKAILKAAEGAKALHIVDFGILYGFQWPILIKHLADREGGPPRLRITGIEFPQKGFRPAERLEETGRRLEKYCHRFGVEFEYHSIASEHWDSIKLSDITLRPGETLAVNSLMRLKNLLDETATLDKTCPRNVVLKLIRELNPAVFVQSISSGAYNAPFFVTRFREALFHYSALFDALDCNIPRGNEERLMYEREFFGREIVNVVACEGSDRVERPETYKQWNVRNTRAGFRPVPLDRELMAKFREKIRAWYHKDFVIDEDNNWMLQGWKGRIVYASCCWVPNS